MDRRIDYYHGRDVLSRYSDKDLCDDLEKYGWNGRRYAMIKGRIDMMKEPYYTRCMQILNRKFLSEMS